MCKYYKIEESLVTITVKSEKKISTKSEIKRGFCVKNYEIEVICRVTISPVSPHGFHKFHTLCDKLST